MKRGMVDHDGMSSEWANTLRNNKRPTGMPFNITRLGHVVLRVTDLTNSVAFYCEALGFEISDVYPESMMPGGMVFLRFNGDHHGIALVGGARGPTQNAEMHHMAFEVSTLDEVIRARNHLRTREVTINFEGRRRAGCQIAIEFQDPDGHQLEIYWGLDQIGSDGTARRPEQWCAEQSLAKAIANPPAGQDTTLHDPILEP